MYSIGDIMKINKNSLLPIALFLLAALLICFSAQAKDGALLGFTLAQKVVIPSLLPLLILFNLVQEITSQKPAGKFSKRLMRVLFHLPGCCFPTVLFGLIGGYPAGALLTASLYGDEKITRREACRIMRFNMSGGAGFIITAVGVGILKSKKAGLILFASVTAAAIICAAVSGIFAHGENITQSEFARPRNTGDALNKSVEASLRSVLNLSAYIILFCAFQGILHISEILAPIIEITSGITNASGRLTLPQTAFLLAFGGFCVHLQILPVLKKIKMPYFKFFAWRLLCAALSFLICILLLRIFPQEAEVFSNFSGGVVRSTSINASLSVLMLLGSAVLIFDLENRKKQYI